MKVTVQCFGHYADVFGSDAKIYSVQPGAAVADLVKQLESQYPSMANLSARCRFAVNEEYTQLDTVLQEGDVVAVIPPMSGG